MFRGVDVGLRRGFVGAVVQRSGGSTAAQELRAAEQGGRCELGFGVAAAMGMRRREAAGAFKEEEPGISAWEPGRKGHGDHGRRYRPVSVA